MTQSSRDLETIAMRDTHTKQTKKNTHKKLPTLENLHFSKILCMLSLWITPQSSDKAM